MEKGKSQEVGMTGLCQQCQAELPEGRIKFCSVPCGTRYHNEQRKGQSQANIEDAVTREIDQTAHQLVIRGFLPAPYQIDPYDSRPLWDFSGLAQLFDRPPHELIELLLQNGPAHLESDRGIPSSWQSIERMTL